MATEPNKKDLQQDFYLKLVNKTCRIILTLPNGHTISYTGIIQGIDKTNKICFYDFLTKKQIFLTQKDISQIIPQQEERGWQGEETK